MSADRSGSPILNDMFNFVQPVTDICPLPSRFRCGAACHPCFDSRIAFLNISAANFFLSTFLVNDTIPPMKLQDRLKLLRKEIGISQEAIGAQGFVSAPGWVKLENGQRLPSDKLLMRLISWILKEEYFDVKKAARVLEELLTLKYLSHRSGFVRRIARSHAEGLFGSASVHLAEEPAVYRTKPQRRPVRSKKN